MYRSYEDVFYLEDLLTAAKKRLEEAENMDDLDGIIDAQMSVAELEDRINYAWQDDEYDSDY